MIFLLSYPVEKNDENRAGQQERIVINHMPWYDVCRVPDDIRYQIKVYHLQKYGFRRKYSCGQNKQSFLVTDKERISFQHCEYQEDCARQIETNPPKGEFRYHGRPAFCGESGEEEQCGQKDQKTV